MTKEKEKIAVVVFQLGGPDSIGAIEPFLTNLFSDPDIINFPGAFLARKALARFIASRRSAKVAHHYREIGGKSPIAELTRLQAKALESRLHAEIGATVYVAMRYWHPLTSETIEEMKSRSFTKVILLPLYPHFSKATTKSSSKEWNRQCGLLDYHPSTESVCCFYSHPLYIEAVTENINIAYNKLSGIPPEEIDLVFSAHGIPLSLVREGDPYQMQIAETVRLLLAKGQWKSPHQLCYQSKVGPAEWLKPSLHSVIAELGRRGRKHVVVIPLSFVTEHIETLYEINIETREEALAAGITHFEMMPALNDHPTFIECLADLVLKKTRGEPLGLPSCKRVAADHSLPSTPALCPCRTQSDR